VLPSPLELESFHLGTEAMHTQKHLPWSFAVCPPRPIAHFSIVLPDTSARTHCETDVMASFVPGIQIARQVTCIESRTHNLLFLLHCCSLLEKKSFLFWKRKSF
jgi:hypothetical protein